MTYGQVNGVGKPVARIVHGTTMLTTDALEQGMDLLDGVFAAGGTTFDSAWNYGGGDCERVLGAWMERRGNRGQVVILTKGCHPNQDRVRVTPADLTSDLMDSLARLSHRLRRPVPAAPRRPHASRSTPSWRRWPSTTRPGASTPTAGPTGACRASRRRTPTRPGTGCRRSRRAAPTTAWPCSSALHGPAACRSAARRRPATATGTAARSSRCSPGRAWPAASSPAASAATNPGRTPGREVLSADTYCSEGNFDRLEAAQAIGRAHGVSAARVALAYIMQTGLDVYPIAASATPGRVRGQCRSPGARTQLRGDREASGSRSGVDSSHP